MTFPVPTDLHHAKAASIPVEWHYGIAERNPCAGECWWCDHPPYLEGERWQSYVYRTAPKLIERGMRPWRTLMSTFDTPEEGMEYSEAQFRQVMAQSIAGGSTFWRGWAPKSVGA